MNKKKKNHYIVGEKSGEWLMVLKNHSYVVINFNKLLCDNKWYLYID